MTNIKYYALTEKQQFLAPPPKPGRELIRGVLHTLIGALLWMAYAAALLTIFTGHPLPQWVKL